VRNLSDVGLRGVHGRETSTADLVAVENDRESKHLLHRGASVINVDGNGGGVELVVGRDGTDTL
jgi:hypothetical protein